MSRCQILAALLGVPPRLLSVAGVHPSTRCWRVRSLRAHVCLLLNHPLPTGDHQWITTSPSIPPRGPAPGPLPKPKSTASLRVDHSRPWLRRADLTLAPSSERKPTANDRLKQDIRTCPLAAKPGSDHTPEVPVASGRSLAESTAWCDHPSLSAHCLTPVVLKLAP